MLAMQDVNGFVARAELDRMASEFLRWSSPCLDAIPAPAALADASFSPLAATNFDRQLVDEPIVEVPLFVAERKPTVHNASERSAKSVKRRAYQLPARTRQKNRAAQQRFRQRQKERQQEMKSELDELKEQNELLQTQVEALEERVKALQARVPLVE